MLRLRESGLPFSILHSVEVDYWRHPTSLTAQADPRKDACLRLAAHNSLVRRRAAGTLGTPLPAFSTSVEAVQ